MKKCYMCLLSIVTLSINKIIGFNLPQLKLINVIFRHGDRQPNDEVNGDLTKIGRQRAYELGEMLRERYGDFLSNIYESSAVSARSTEYARAKISLQLLLASLYVPQEHQKWHESLAWQPIPFQYSPHTDDVLLFPKDCPRFIRQQQAIESTLEFQRRFTPYREMWNEIAAATGEKMENSYDMFIQYHKLDSMRSMNQSIPKWFTEYFPDGLLLNGTFLEYELLKFTDYMRKVNGGALVRKVVDDMQNKTDIKFASKRKLFLYSTHELLIVSVLQTLKLWKPHIPEYSSAIIIELREDRQNYYVKVLYYKGIQGVFKEMQIPGCSSLCPLPRFIELISDQLPKHSEIICDEKPINFNDLSSY